MSIKITQTFKGRPFLRLTQPWQVSPSKIMIPSVSSRKIILDKQIVLCVILTKTNVNFCTSKSWQDHSHCGGFTVIMSYIRLKMKTL